MQFVERIGSRNRAETWRLSPLEWANRHCRAPQSSLDGVNASAPGFGRHSWESRAHFTCGIAAHTLEVSLMSGAEADSAEPIDPVQDLGEQGARHRYLGQLDHHVAAVAHDPGADLDQLLAQL
jgi:hypothetical protein